MPIRVISGHAKGRKLKLVPGDGTRPIMDRAKEALFNIIGSDILDSQFIDLFAGTGSVGIEALSRGAERVTFVELAKPAIKTIQENLAITKLGDHANIRKIDVLELLKQPSPRVAYDFIYVAPPQYKDLWLKTLQTIDNNPDWVGDETILIVQIDPKEKTDATFKHIESYDERRYGKTLLWFFQKSVLVDNSTTEDKDSHE